MAIIQFTKADTLRAKLLPEAWMSWEVKSIPAPTKNSKGDGYNYTVTFALIDCTPELAGKELQRVFSNKAISMMLPLVAACNGQTLDDIKEGFDLDPDTLVGKKIDGKVELDTYEGQQKNILEQYAPYKSIVGKAVQF